jgi:predicted ATPase
MPEPSTAPAEAPTTVADAAAEWGHFVGREEETARLRGALDDALAGRARLVMVVGEPGIGKTRTVEQLAAEATVRGARVLWGHAYEGDIGAPHLPFVDVLRALTRDLADGELVDLAASNIAEIASLVPDLHARVPDIAQLPKLEGDAERYRMYEAITSFLRSVARERPLVLVLEDLHWADKPSLMLLQYLARSLGSDRLLIVGTYRDVDLERTHPLSDALVALCASSSTNGSCSRG